MNPATCAICVVQIILDGGVSSVHLHSPGMATSGSPSLDVNTIATVVAGVVSSLQSQAPSTHAHAPPQPPSRAESSAAQSSPSDR